MSFTDTEILLILIIIIFTIVQSIFGVGLLVFGTPSLLLLEYSFTETLTYLIPCSIIVSSLQVYSSWHNITLYRFNVFYYISPMVILGLLVVLHTTIINLYLLIGIMLILTSFVRFHSSLNKFLGHILMTKFKLGLAVVGLVHGLTNLGGAPLVAITNSIYNKKAIIQSNIAYAYLSMAIIQLIILIIVGDFIFNTLILILPFCSAVIYLLVGKKAFESTDEIKYNNLMSFFMLVYGIVLILNYF